MVQDRRRSIAFKQKVCFRFLILYVLDSLLSFFVLPVVGVVFWFTVDIGFLALNESVRIYVLLASAFVFLYSHLACKTIYRLVCRYATVSTIRFFVVSKSYIYVTSVSGVIIYDGFFDNYVMNTFIKDLLLNCGLAAVSFALLLSIKCYPHLAATSSQDVGGETTPEDVFLFPYRIFECSVLFTEHVGNRFVYLFCSRLYTEIFGVASVSSWYGIWTAFDTIAGLNTRITVVVVLISSAILFCTKTVRNITASPFAIITDRKQGYFDVPTLFRWSFHWKKNKCLYILDSIFSVFIVGTLVILVWRGVWSVLDEVLSRNEKEYATSGWISLVIGYTVVIVTFVLQSLMKMLMKKYDGWKRLIVLDTYIVISFCGTINVWRGIWVLLESYTKLNESLSMSLFLHFVSFFILVIFNASNTLLVRGVYIDAEESGEDCVEFPCYYFRLRFQAKQKEKTFEELDKFNTQIWLVNRKKIDNTSVKSADVDHSTDLEMVEQHSTLLTSNVDGKCDELLSSPLPTHDRNPRLEPAKT